MTDRMIDSVPHGASADAFAARHAAGIAEDCRAEPMPEPCMPEPRMPEHHMPQHHMDEHHMLELKSDEPASLAAMADMLGRMRMELDQQFRTFADLRDGAVRRAGEDQPEGEAKLARADLKAAVDALSVIVRTLEKVDQLERQLARDRADLEAQPESQDSYDALWAEVSVMIEARVEERLAERVLLRLSELGIEPPLHAGAPPGETGWREPGLAARGGGDATG